MDQTYNNERGIELLKIKIPNMLRIAGMSAEMIDTVVATTLQQFGSKVGAMPVDGLLSASAVAEAIVTEAKNGHDVEEVRTRIINMHTVPMQTKTHVDFSQRIEHRHTHGFGRAEYAELSDAASALHQEIEDNVNDINIVESKMSGKAQTIPVNPINMVDYTETEDLTAEGQRARGFLPATFDTMDALTEVDAPSKRQQRLMGSYGYDAYGELYISCPECNSQDVIPAGAGTYMCLNCEDSTLFDVDLLLSDLLPPDAL